MQTNISSTKELFPFNNDVWDLLCKVKSCKHYFTVHKIEIQSNSLDKSKQFKHILFLIKWDCWSFKLQIPVFLLIDIYDLCCLFLCHTFFLLVAIQCLESSYGIDTSDEQTVAKYQIQKNLLDIFNAQLNVEVTELLKYWQDIVLSCWLIL